MFAEPKTEKKMTASIIAIVILSFCLCVTTFALIWSTVSVEENFFHTGAVKINLNDGKPVIEEHEFLFEPGMTVEKTFFLENESTCDVWYRLYFMNVKGGLADVLEVLIKKGDTVLYYGKISDMTKENTMAADDVLRLHERKEMTITFHFPESATNEAQNLYLNFDICADAVQTKNNEYKLFN